MCRCSCRWCVDLVLPSSRTQSDTPIATDRQTDRAAERERQRRKRRQTNGNREREWETARKQEKETSVPSTLFTGLEYDP
eukprot:1245970-Rhodomonas_salina.1